ncbi:MAG: hypothetical protein ACTHK2_05015 [Dokdonella sp.]|uniref:hypothetical protein n=1 Tax=Dokdonella sp. TaxID=2291710 RepID=UPI003F805A9E
MSDITLGPLELSEDLQWVDEYDDGSDLVGQQETVTITGAVIVQASAQQTGRKVTLQGKRESGNTAFGAMTRAQIEAVRSLAATAGAVYTLALSDGRTFSVMFRRSDGPAVSAEPLKHILPPADDDLYFPTIRLIMV